MQKFKTILLTSGALAIKGTLMAPFVILPISIANPDSSSIPWLVGVSLTELALSMIGLIGCVIHNECYPPRSRAEVSPTSELCVTPSPLAPSLTTPLTETPSTDHGTFNDDTMIEIPLNQPKSPASKRT